jgi:deoxyribodipyrimidine photo-lyase
MRMKTSIIWFKTDLRLYDNETLVRAIAESDMVIPVYCFDDSYYTVSEFGFKKTGSFRAQFILEALDNLDQRLRELDSGLIVVKGNPEKQLAMIARLYNATAVYAKKEVAPDEVRIQNRIAVSLKASGCALHTVGEYTLFSEEDLPFSIDTIPDVFTNFKIKVQKHCKVRDVVLRPETIPSPKLPTLMLPTMQQLGLEPIERDSRASINFVGGEKCGLERINKYFYDTHAIAHYKETRNNLSGENYSSKLAPWLAQGCLSPRAVYHEIKDYEKEFGTNDGTEWLVFELLWRDYFCFMMCKHQTKFFDKGGIKNDPPVHPPHNERIFRQWVNGETGNDFIDANMHELKLTGFMSNRGRQNVASYLCHDLKIDWRYGAAYFEQQLIDYDVCNNWGNWAYIAGVGNDPRQNRYFNIQKQAVDYDADGSYRKLWLS